MLAIILSWIFISYIFLSLGDALVWVYNKLSSRDETYSVLDTFLLGLCSTSILLSITSLGLPSNQYMLAALTLLSTGYWLARRNRFGELLTLINSRVRSFSLFQILLMVLPIVGLILANSWESGVLDSLYYHQQNIRWNEEFAVVPGLGNLEHRFGFNSNYMLISAIFTFRFVFGEALYTLQALLAIYILCWTMIEVFKSGYEVKRVALLFVYLAFVFTYSYTMTSTSTDAIPSFVFFYVVAKLLLYPKFITERMLLVVAIPVLMVTFKLTVIPFCLIALYLLIRVFRKRDVRTGITLLAIGTLIVVPWVVRNIIISGYLVFPFHEIDIFSFDWKIPEYVAVHERAFIINCGVDVLNMLIDSFSHPRLSLASAQEIGIGVSLFTFVFISPLAMIFTFVKRKYIHKSIYYIYGILLLVICIWAIGGPDPRFIGGCLFVTIYVVLFILLNSRKERYSKPIGLSVLLLTSGLLTAWGGIRTSNVTSLLNDKGTLGETYTIKDILYKPFSHRRQLHIYGRITEDFRPYELNNGIVIYISKSENIDYSRKVTYDVLPATVLRSDDIYKYQDVSTIEARGYHLQDGFRVKEAYREDEKPLDAKE